jgi:hypothetical protein
MDVSKECHDHTETDVICAFWNENTLNQVGEKISRLFHAGG